MWDPGEIWLNRTAVIIGGGPSLNLEQLRIVGMARAKDEIRTVAVNDAVYVAAGADLLWACDAPWIRYHEGVPNFHGYKATMQATSFADWHVVGNGGTTGFDDRRGFVRTGGNGVYQALNFMVHLGIKRIVLIGVDMAGGHWHGGHPPTVSSPKPNWDNRARDFAELAEALAERNIRVANCSPGTHLSVFPRGELGQVLRIFRDDETRRRPEKPA